MPDEAAEPEVEVVSLTVTAKVSPADHFDDMGDLVVKVQHAARAADPSRVELRCSVSEQPISGLISPGGAVEVVGATSEKMAREALGLMVKHLSDQLGQALSDSDFAVVGAVASARCGFRLDLERLACEASEKKCRKPNIIH